MQYLELWHPSLVERQMQVILHQKQMWWLVIIIISNMEVWKLRMYLINYHMNKLKNEVSILRTIGKLDLMSIDVCRKEFAKKNPNLYEPYEAQFTTNAAETLGWDVLEAHSIWNLLKEFNFSNTLKLTNILGLNLKNGPHKKTKMKRYIYNLIKQAVDYQYVLKFGDNPPFFEEEDMNKLKNYVDGELRDLVDKIGRAHV